MDYGVLAVKQSPRNIGDDVQGLAAAQFLPQVDRFLDRDDLLASAGEPETFAIMNGWFTWRPDLFPPPPSVRPFWLAFHVATPHLLTQAMAAHLKAHEPIGARDLHTLHLLRGMGIEAYWSGCLTVTLPRSEAPRGDEVLIIDVQRKMQRYVPRSVRRGAVRLTNEVRHPEDPQARFDLARRNLDRLARARLVVTSRLHVALPCSALGTPCVMLHGKIASDVRFGGIRGNLLRGYDRFTVDSADWDPKPIDIDPMRDFLSEVTRAAVERQGNPFAHASFDLPEAVLRVGGPPGTLWG